MSRLRKQASLLDLEDDDPLSGVANLFDVAMVFAIALLVALVAKLDLQPQTAEAQDQPADEAPTIADSKRERFQESSQTGQGQGVRLGTAYRLDSGEVVYVPDGTAPSDFKE